MPAAAVIPAPVAYIKVVAVKRLVVELMALCTWPPPSWGCSVGVHGSSFWRALLPLIGLVV